MMMSWLWGHDQMQKPRSAFLSGGFSYRHGSWDQPGSKLSELRIKFRDMIALSNHRLGLFSFSNKKTRNPIIFCQVKDFQGSSKLSIFPMSLLRNRLTVK